MTRSLDSLERLAEVPSPAFVVFTDFDETYLAHGGSPEQRRDLRSLEELLGDLAARRRVLFGWVTGSTIESVASKVEAHGLRVAPHFIASAIGSELDLFSKERGRHADPAWDARIAASGFSKERVAALRAALAEEGVALRRQKQTGVRIESYYYFRRGEARDAWSVARIRELAAAHGVGVNVSPCNPLVGDPADAYDVDFVPIVCGKRNTVQFILGRYGVGPDRAFAFGDNVGDLEMLEAVAHGYLVANATAEARKRFGRLSEGSYARGILEVLERALSTV